MQRRNVSDRRLKEGRVLIVGLGGLGSPAALYLAAAGLGTIGLADAEPVELSNLHRQIIHFTADVGRLKVESAREKLLRINERVNVEIYPVALNGDNAASIIRKYQMVLDGTDNFPAKFLLNDVCCQEKVPLVHAGALRFLGQVMTIIPGESACYRCVFLEPPPAEAVPTCQEAGVLGPMVGHLGIIQAAEALNYILGRRPLLVNRLLTCDALGQRWREVEVAPNPDCPLCDNRGAFVGIKKERVS